MCQAELPNRNGTAIELFERVSSHAIACHTHLHTAAFTVHDIESRVTGKSFQVISANGSNLRQTPYNTSLFISSSTELRTLHNRFIEIISNPSARGSRFFISNSGDQFSCAEFNRYIYTIAMSFSILKKIQAPGDRKVAGSFLEYISDSLLRMAMNHQLITNGYSNTTNGHRADISLDIHYLRQVQIENQTNTQVVAIPVKMSTRERNTQIYFHHSLLTICEQRRSNFPPLTVPLICNEYNAQRVREPLNAHVVETAIPGTWRSYNTLVPLGDNVYYLDIPRSYVAPPAGCPNYLTWGNLFLNHIDNLI